MPAEQSSVKHASDVPEQTVSGGKDATRQVLIGPEEGPNFAMRRFIMQPGGGMPKHTNTVEHEQYVLRGAATVGIGDRTVEVKTGDVVYIPAGTPHWYHAKEGEPFEFFHIPKGYIYFAMGFSVFVEMLNIRLKGVGKPVKLHDGYREDAKA